MLRDAKNSDLLPRSSHWRHFDELDQYMPRFSVGEWVPSYVEVLYQQMALLIREVRKMRQSTTDMVTALNGLIANSALVDKAIDDLVMAQAGDDEAAIKDATDKLKSLKVDQDTHLSGLVSAAPIVVASPVDPTPVVLDSPPAG